MDYNLPNVVPEWEDGVIESPYLASSDDGSGVKIPPVFRGGPAWPYNTYPIIPPCYQHSSLYGIWWDTDIFTCDGAAEVTLEYYESQ